MIFNGTNFWLIKRLLVKSKLNFSVFIIPVCDVNTSAVTGILLFGMFFALSFCHEIQGYSKLLSGF